MQFNCKVIVRYLIFGLSCLTNSRLDVTRLKIYLKDAYKLRTRRSLRNHLMLLSSCVHVTSNIKVVPTDDAHAITLKRE